MNKHNFLLLFLIIILIPLNTYSMPRYSVKLGNKCIDCHYNPTGGIMRSLDGWHWGKNTLSMISTRDKDFLMSPKISDNISIGIDYRTQFLYSQEKGRSDFQQMTGSAYSNIAIARNINIMGKYDFVNSLWEGYVTANILPDKSYIKAGSFSPNYGIRIDDHTAYTRGGDFGLLFTTGAYQGLIYNPLYTEAGIEAGYYGGDFLFATASAGANLLSNRTLSNDPTYTARIELTPRIKGIGLLFGGSYAAAKVPEAVNMYGGFMGIGYDEFTLLTEYDIADDLMGIGVKSNVLMIQAAYLIFTGLEAIIRYDRIDPNDNINADEAAHLVVGVEFHPYQFIEIRPQYRFIIEDPSVKNDAFVLQFHFWY
jgi:hypothetical protein